MKASDLFVRCLENEGVRHVFGVPGEETLDLLDSLSRSRRIAFVTTRHEQGAAFMADVYGRLTAQPGVCLATLGPGATNLVTGVADAFLDRAPLVAITGQAARASAFKESHQSLDVVGLLRPVTKWNARVEQAATIPEIVRKAFRLAGLEKPGATHVELPEDVAAEEVDGAPMPVRGAAYPPAGPDRVERAAALLRGAARPLILAGNGVVRRHAAGHGGAERLGAFARRLGLPVVPTFMGKGALDERDALARPAVGLRAPSAALGGLAEADVVLAIGYDLVEWSPRLWNGGKDKTIVHIDSTPAEVDAHYLTAVELVGEIGESLDALGTACAFAAPRWLDAGARHPAPDEGEHGRDDAAFPVKPQRLVADLRAALGERDVVISDVGAHKLWLATRYPSAGPNTLVVSNGLAAMGIAVPGAVAAKLVQPDRRVVAVTGDGGFLMNAPEPETAKRLGTAFVTVVCRDERYGAIELNQRRRFGRAFGVGFTNPDFVQFAGALGLPGFRVERAEDLLPALRRALDLDVPSVVDVSIDPAEHRRLGAA